MKIDEGILSLVVNTLKFNAVVLQRGNFITLRVKLPFSKSDISISVQKETFKQFKEWINSIENV